MIETENELEKLRKCQVCNVAFRLSARERTGLEILKELVNGQMEVEAPEEEFEHPLLQVRVLCLNCMMEVQKNIRTSIKNRLPESLLERMKFFDNIPSMVSGPERFFRLSEENNKMPLGNISRPDWKQGETFLPKGIEPPPTLRDNYNEVFTGRPVMPQASVNAIRDDVFKEDEETFPMLEVAQGDFKDVTEMSSLRERLKKMGYLE